jgi:hypothetical protein
VPTPTIDPLATPTPFPTGGPGAFLAVRNYEDALLAGSWAKAYAMLGKGTQTRWGGTLAKFQANRIKYLADKGSAFREELDPTDTLTLNQWIEGRGFTVDVAKAHLVSIKWTAIPDPQGWEVWVVTPTKTGTWVLYLGN